MAQKLLARGDSNALFDSGEKNAKLNAHSDYKTFLSWAFEDELIAGLFLLGCGHLQDLHL